MGEFGEFTFGPWFRLRETGVFTLETWKDRWADVLAEVAFPDRFRFVVSAVDREGGIITLREDD